MKLIDSFAPSETVLTAAVINKLTDSELREVALALAGIRLGMSSAGLVRWALLTPGADSYRGPLPRDRGDLGRCEKASEAAPEWLRARMLPLLAEFREHVGDRC